MGLKNLSVPSALAPTATPLPINFQLTKAARDYFNSGLYLEAITKAQECIDQFEDQVLREQQAFNASGTPTPPVGIVNDEKMKEEIVVRSLLNDVATCYFIIGQAIEKLNLISEAKEVYQHGLTTFPDARVLGQEGYIWSPARAASDRLKALQ